MDKKKKKGGLAKRYQTSYDNKGSSGVKSGVMNYKKLDRDDIEFFTPKEGRNRINIVPYVVKSKNHPLVKSGDLEIGDKDYIMDVFVHRGIGPSESSVVCLKETYGKPCPICEQAAALKKQGKEKEAAALKPSRRAFYNVIDSKEPEKLKVFETSHYLFEKELIEEARDDEEGGFVDFADEENGKEIKFRCSKVTKSGMEFNEFKSFSFEERDDNIPDELLEKAISFDEILNVPTYEEAEKILYGSDDDDEEDEDEPKSKKSKSKSKYEDDEDEDDEDEDDEDEDEDDEDEDEDDEPKKSSKSKSKKSKSDDEDEEDEDDEDEPAPKKSSKKSKSEDEEDDDEEDDEDDDEDEDDEDDEEDEEDDEPAPKSKKSKSKSDDEDDDEPAPKSKKKDCKGDCTKCPFGHKFGEDTDDFDECDDCELWPKCVKGKK